MKNEEVRSKMEVSTVVAQKIYKAIEAHPTAVRWTTAPWEKGYALSLWSDIEVYDANDQLVCANMAIDFIEDR